MWIIAVTIVGVVGVVGFSCATPLGAAALSYSALPFQATVIDKETGKPMEGVIAAAVWHLEERDGRGAGFLNVTEAVTDANGVFRMPGWGPLEVQRSPQSGISPPRLAPDEPSLILFKHGYRVGVVAGEGVSTHYLSEPRWTGDPVRTSYWGGKTIKLERFIGDDRAYQRHLSFSQWSPIGGCMWAKAPRMTAALIVEGERLGRVTGLNEFPTLSRIPETDHGQYCGSPQTILGPLLK